MSVYPRGLQYLTVKGGDAATGLFNAVRLDQHVLVGVITPAAWTAANLTIQAGNTVEQGATVAYADVYDVDGTEYTITAAASRFIQLEPAALAGFGWIKVRSGTTGTPVQQAASRDLILVVRPVA